MATYIDRLVVLPSSGIVTRIAANDTIELSAGNLIIGGDLTVNGTRTINNTETVLIADNHTYINSGYTTNSAQTGGLVVNYLPTATTDSTAGAGVFTAGVDGVSDPTVTTNGTATFSAGDLIQISGTANGGENDGLYEIQGHTGTTLTIRSTANGVTNQAEDFTNDQFVATTDTGASITKVTVSVLRAGTDGAWETGSGSTTGITFSDLATVAGATLQAAYVAGNTITLSDAEGDLVFTLDDTGAAADFQVTDSGGDYILTDATNNSLDLGSAANTVDFVGSAGVTSTGNGAWDFGTGQADFGGNLDANAGLDVTAGALTMTGTNIDLDPTGTFALDMDAAQTVTITIADNLADAFLVRQAGFSYLDITTTDSSEAINLGNTTTNPTLTQLGSGQVTFNGNVDATNGLDITGANATIADDLQLVFGNDSNWGIKYDETTDNALEILGAAAPTNTLGYGFSIVGSTGGAAGGAVAGGNGGAAEMISGVGGAAVTGASNTAGVGGTSLIQGGTGGAGFTSEHDGGNGGLTRLFGGTGGAGAIGQTGGTGGLVIIQGGAGGNAAGGTEGNGGDVTIRGGDGLTDGSVNIGTTTTTSITMGTATVAVNTVGGILMDERSTPAAAATDTGYLYTKADGTDTELFFFSDLSGTDTEVQITKDGFLNAGAIVNTEFVAATGGVSAGDALYLASGTEVGLADATTASGADFVIGFAVSAATATNTVELIAAPGTTITTGTITGFSAAGDIVYLSETAGALTTTAPTASGSTIFRVGYAITATTILFQPAFVALNP